MTTTDTTFPEALQAWEAVRPAPLLPTAAVVTITPGGLTIDGCHLPWHLTPTMGIDCGSVARRTQLNFSVFADRVSVTDGDGTLWDTDTAYPPKNTGRDTPKSTGQYVANHITLDPERGVSIDGVHLPWDLTISEDNFDVHVEGALYSITVLIRCEALHVNLPANVTPYGEQPVDSVRRGHVIEAFDRDLKARLTPAAPENEARP